MAINLVIELLVVSVIFFYIVYRSIKKQRLSVQYSLIWLFAAILMLLALFIPGLLQSFANFLGIKTVSNMIFLIGFLLLMIICFGLTSILSSQKRKIITLTQELGILKNEVNKNK